MARPSNTANRRKEIASALLVVMSKHGYEGATTAAIAEKAKLAPGLIHYHFQSKQEILIEAIQLLSAKLESRFEQLSEGAATPRDRLAAFVNARLAIGEGSDPEAVSSWVAIAAESVRQPEVKEAFKTAFHAQKNTLERLIADYAEGHLSQEENACLTSTILSAMEGAFLLSSVASDVMPKGYAASTVMKLIERYVSR